MHREFVELTKEIYVDVARRDYGLRGRPTNVSRVALLTGLDRKEVSRVRDRIEQAAGETAAQPRQQDRIARLLSGWHQDADYRTPDGAPRVLPLAGPAPSYADLVDRYAGDVPGITILRELERTGAVRMHEGDRVEVLRRNYRLDTAEPEALERAGSVLADIGRTVAHNLHHEPSEPSRFEARASNVRVPRAALDDYRELVYAECQTFLERIDAWLTAHEAPDDDATTERVGLGIYWIQSETPGRQGGGAAS